MGLCAACRICLPTGDHTVLRWARESLFPRPTRRERADARCSTRPSTRLTTLPPATATNRHSASPRGSPRSEDPTAFNPSTSTLISWNPNFKRPGFTNGAPTSSRNSVSFWWMWVTSEPKAPTCRFNIRQRPRRRRGHVSVAVPLPGLQHHDLRHSDGELGVRFPAGARGAGFLERIPAALSSHGASR